MTNKSTSQDSTIQPVSSIAARSFSAARDLRGARRLIQNPPPRTRIPEWRPSRHRAAAAPTGVLGQLSALLAGSKLVRAAAVATPTLAVTGPLMAAVARADEGPKDAALPERDLRLGRAPDVQRLSNHWTPETKVYATQDVPVAEATLRQLNDYLVQHAPNWTVFVARQAPYAGRVVHDSLVKSLQDDYRYQKQVDLKTGRQNAVVATVFLEDRKFYVHVEKPELMDGGWVDHMGSVFTAGMRSGKGVDWAVRDMVQAAHEEGRSLSQGEIALIVVLGLLALGIGVAIYGARRGWGSGGGGGSSSSFFFVDSGGGGGGDCGGGGGDFGGGW